MEIEKQNSLGIKFNWMVIFVEFPFKVFPSNMINWLDKDIINKNNIDFATIPLNLIVSLAFQAELY